MCALGQFRLYTNFRNVDGFLRNEPGRKLPLVSLTCTSSTHRTRSRRGLRVLYLVTWYILFIYVSSRVYNRPAPHHNFRAFWKVLMNNDKLSSSLGDAVVETGKSNRLHYYVHIIVLIFGHASTRSPVLLFFFCFALLVEWTGGWKCGLHEVRGGKAIDTVAFHCVSIVLWTFRKAQFIAAYGLCTETTGLNEWPNWKF